MKFIYVNNYSEMSEVASEIMLDEVKSKNDLNICLASGGSPELTYQLFVKKMKDNKIDAQKIYITKLDEWVGIDKTSDLSCEKYLKDIVVDPLQLSDHFISFLPNEIPEKEVEKVNEKLKQNPIDLCILGLGKNGHLGLNEPNTYLYAESHVAKLSEKTKKHPMIYGKNNHIEYGMSIGMKNILDSKRIILLVSGTEKDEIFAYLKKGEISTQCPASFLWLHNNTIVIVRLDQFSK